MPKPDKDLLRPKSEREELFDAILGPDEEMDDELADEILSSYDLTGSQLVEEFKVRLQSELKRHFEETNEISKPLETALKSIMARQRASEPAPVEAEPWIGSVLAGSVASSAPAELLYSWHKQKEGAVSDKDKRILDELEGELKEK
jgi:hypothetical protein